MRSNRIAATALGLLVAFAPATSWGVYVFQSIDYQVVDGQVVPGGTFTQTWGINDNGEIAMEIADQDNAVSYVYQASTGTLTRLPDPTNGLLASPLGINNAGLVVGTAYPADNSFHFGYVLSNGTYQFFSNPGYGFTEARAIGSDGIVTGWSYTGLGAASTGIALIYDPATGSFTEFSVSGALATLAQGRNAAGQVVGSSYAGVSSNGEFFNQTAFLREPDGTITSFRLQGFSTAARGINDNGLIAGFVNTPDGQRAYVGNSNGFELLTCPPDVCPGLRNIGAEAINNLGQIVGGWSENDLGTTLHGFIATPVAMPTGTTSGGGYVFLVNVIPDQTIFIDPKTALGYDYATGAGDPLFATVRLPFGVGDNRYTLIVGGRSFPLAANEVFDFRAHGFALGVSRFRVADIEADAGLDPANSNAFPTGLTFVAAGKFTGSMTPLCRPGNMPDRAKPPAGRALQPCVNS